MMIIHPEKTLGQLFEALLEKDGILQSRRGPIKTALKHYSRLLGSNNFHECPFETYFQSNHARNRLIDEGASRTNADKRNGSIHLGQDAIRNLKNNVSFALRRAVELGIISPQQELLSAKTQPRNFHKRPLRHEYVISSKYILDPIPIGLTKEVSEYEVWSTKIVNPARPGNLLKRQASFKSHRRDLLQLAGYLVKFKGFDRDSITLTTLITGSNPFDFLTWYIERQGRVTRGAILHLAVVTVLARYLLITAHADEKAEVREIVEELDRFRSTLGLPVAVVDKSKRWLSLSELERVRLSVYPLNARRVAELAEGTRQSLLRRKGCSSSGNGRGYASAVLTSLLIGLDIRIPLRQRNLREMLWNPANPEDGQNLYRHHGNWYLRFSGKELKVSFRRGAVNSIEHEFPSDLANLLEEWLWTWRPLQLSGQKERQKGNECSRNGQEFVFLNMRGGPLTSFRVNEAFQNATYKFTGTAVNVHMIRTIWATEYIKATRNVIDAAFMLGDTVETVLKSYAKLLDQDCGKRASQWVAKTLKNEPPSVNGNSGISHDKLEKILRMLKAGLPEGNSDEQLLHSMKDLLK
ncbi:MAG TPA: hypothetical protein VEM96_07810 [Pyrinomonadaceae bacterium]|nr:hypothetical protein [Pyrinomonadaceae bacterium]